MTRLAHEPDAAAGAWIGRRLAPVGTSIGSVVPLGFEAYARVLHPVELGQGRLMRWADVAAATSAHRMRRPWPSSTGWSTRAYASKPSGTTEPIEVPTGASRRPIHAPAAASGSCASLVMAQSSQTPRPPLGAAQVTARRARARGRPGPHRRAGRRRAGRRQD